MMFNSKITKGIILAAGDGDRLGSLTLTRPKVILQVNDTPLISYSIKAMAAAGINDIAIVVGYLGDIVAEELGDGSSFGVRLEYIDNECYLGGNAFSVYCARDWTKSEPVVLCMGDHLIEEEIVRRLLDRQEPTETLCVDYVPALQCQVEEATKVAIDNNGGIRNIGKDINHWDALDSGVFLLTESFFQALDRLVRQYGNNVEMSGVIRHIISHGNRFNTCDISGCSWMDVDTEEDLKLARV